MTLLPRRTSSDIEWYKFLIKTNNDMVLATVQLTKRVKSTATYIAYGMEVMEMAEFSHKTSQE